ncbi:hypothetical protein KFE25_009026 [Diacronema lutheri]|uniref:Uncharacterized protein n=2 Tax=Diacronema lutheri TaxID=2081491 RepID=A0A8J5Y353_DIALT|nr:hypothetical protein KFE25_009026 [Diacronema lutheri]
MAATVQHLSQTFVPASSSLRRNPSAEELQELGQILSLLHTSPPRTVFPDQDRAWRATVVARELHRRALWRLPKGAAGTPSAEPEPYGCVDSAIQLITILLDAAERMRRDGDMEQAAALLDESLRIARATRLLIPFMRGGRALGEETPAETDGHSLEMGRLFKAEAEACMRFALLLVPARGTGGELIGLVGAYSLITDAAASEAQSFSNDWQAAQMIGLVRDAICTALSWQGRQERVATSILDGVRHRAVYDEDGNPLEQPVDIRVSRPVASELAELDAKLSARNDLSVRFGNLGEAHGDSEDDARLPPGAGVMFQCWQPCIEAFVTEAGAVRLRFPECTPEDCMMRELSVGATGASCALDLVRLETSQELHAVLRMLSNNLAAGGTADAVSEKCLPALYALFRLALGDEQPSLMTHE